MYDFIVGVRVDRALLGWVHRLLPLQIAACGGLYFLCIQPKNARSMIDSDKWDRRFLGLAKHISSWSKDPSTRVGAVIVDDSHRIVSVGFNGLPHGVSDDPELLEDRAVKLECILHAEDNALLFAPRPVEGCTIYVYPYPPCSRCAAKIVQMGIRRVVAPEPPAGSNWAESFELAGKLFEGRVLLDLKY